MPVECRVIIVLKLRVGCQRMGYLEFLIPCIRAHGMYRRDQISIPKVTARVQIIIVIWITCGFIYGGFAT